MKDQKKSFKKTIDEANRLADRHLFKHKVEDKLLQFRKWAVEPAWISNGQCLVIFICLVGFVVY